MGKTFASPLASVMAAAGIGRIFGPALDCFDDLRDAVAEAGLGWVDVPEAVALFAAEAEARLTGNLAVAAATLDATRLGAFEMLLAELDPALPMLLLAAWRDDQPVAGDQIDRICRTNPAISIVLSRDAADIGDEIGASLRIAGQQRSPVVLVLAPHAFSQHSEASYASGPPIALPAPGLREQLAELLNNASRITLLCGAGCRGGHAEIVTLAHRLKAPTVYAMHGKTDLDYDNPFNAGMAGPFGSLRAYRAMSDCDVLLILGADLPYPAFYPPAPAAIAQIDLRRSAIGRHSRVDLGLVGDVRATIMALLPLLDPKENRRHLDAALVARADDQDISGLQPRALASAVSALAARDAIFLCQGKLAIFWGARALRMNGHRHFLAIAGHAPASRMLGLHYASPGRQLVLFSSLAPSAALIEVAAELRRTKLVVLTSAAEVSRADRQGQPADAYRAVARRMGLQLIRFAGDAAWLTDLEAAMAGDGPALIEAVLPASCSERQIAEAFDRVVRASVGNIAILDEDGTGWISVAAEERTRSSA